MKVVNTQKFSGVAGNVNIKIDKRSENEWHFFINNSHVISLMFVDKIKEFKPVSVCVDIGMSRQKRGVYISKNFCPCEILKILTGNETEDLNFLKQAFECFQKVYACNNSNYGFSAESYKKMMNRFFVHPTMIQKMGKGDDLTHYFMELPENYIYDSDC